MLPMAQKQLRDRGPRRQTGLRLPARLLDWLADEAHSRGVSLSALVYELLMPWAKAGGYVEEVEGDGDNGDRD